MSNLAVHQQVNCVSRTASSATMLRTYEGSHSIPRTVDQRYTQRRFRHLVISVGATKTPAHPEHVDGVSSRNVRKTFTS
jgi:hypothetical protein